MNDRELKHLKKVAWKEGDSTAAVLFMRPLSIRITSLLMGTKIGPTPVTVSSFLVKIVAALLFALNMYYLTALAGVLVYLSHVLDCVDGEVARAKKMTSGAGSLLDYFLDRLSDIILYSSIAIALFTSTNDPRMLLLGMLVIASNFFMTDVGQAATNLRGRIHVKRRKEFRYLYYGGSANTMILLAASLAHRLLEGMILIGVLSFVFTMGRFVEAYFALSKGENHKKQS
jgi:CDP-L-myo-inositol myo-inositolphosphotransferase